jgi:LasA protease
MRFIWIILLSVLILSACQTSIPSDLATTPEQVLPTIWIPTRSGNESTPSLSYFLPQPGDLISSPTPDAPHYLSSSPRDEEQYIVQSGDILSAIAEIYSTSVDAIVEANTLSNPDSLEVGQLLIIPQVVFEAVGPDIKILPDSELVFGPLANNFNLGELIDEKNGYLMEYTEEVHGKTLSGAEIILQIAQGYSVNPRLLLALVEYKSGWLTNPSPFDTTNPFGYIDDWYTGLYRQLAWAAIHLNSGYYRWREGSVTEWVLADGLVVPIASTINPGTAGVQNFFAKLDFHDLWLIDVIPGGFIDTYYLIFGNPFLYAIEPLVPTSLFQPTMQLPFTEGEIWSYTGGPHLAWDAGTPFAAIDFAPPGEALGCVIVDDWVRAIADGKVIRTGDGVVILDMDMDGNEGSGWVVLYMHIETRDRVTAGTFVKAGDTIGHPSCEGGISSGTHVHIARKFNGEWIAADGPTPFNLDGWISAGSGEEYVGTLTRGGVVVIAYEGNSSTSLIQR